MSLINEALRKAQNQRTQSPGLGDGSSTTDTPMNYPDRPNRSSLMIGLGVCIIILFGLVAGLIFVVLVKDKRSVSQTATIDESQVTKPSVPETATLTPGAEPAPEPGALKTAPAIAETTEQTELQSEAFEKPEVVAEPNQKIVDWLGQSKVTGVRITSSSSKVILNNEAFTPGETVNMTLGLKVFDIQEKHIVFVDSNDVKYIKNL